MKKLISAVFIIMAILAAGCGASLEQFQKEDCITPPGQAALDIIKKNCLRCHSKDFNSNENICAYKSYISDSVESGRMPKFGRLSDEDKKALISWQ